MENALKKIDNIIENIDINEIDKKIIQDMIEFDFDYEKEMQTIENILSKLRQKIKILECKNKYLESLSDCQHNYLIDSIPKQKIKDKIEELKNEKNKRVQLGIFTLKDYENQHLLGEIGSLEEILEESEE